jgi:lysophospholipase L1-like esterase
MKNTLYAGLAFFALLGITGSPFAESKASADTDAQGAEKQLQDWANLARYRQENANLPAPAPGESRVVFMGDSITEFWGRAPGAVFFPGKPYVNRGISGQTTPQMLVRFMPDVVALKPKVVVILAGTNDIAGNTGPMTLQDTENNFIAMTDIARQNGIRVVLSSLTPAFQYPWRPAIQPVAKISALNAWLKDYAAKNGFTYLDYYSKMVDAKGGMKAGLSHDGVHPNRAGYGIMAPAAERAIRQALAKS